MQRASCGGMSMDAQVVQNSIDDKTPKLQAMPLNDSVVLPKLVI
jgi:hypothetical protein